MTKKGFILPLNYYVKCIDFYFKFRLNHIMGH